MKLAKDIEVGDAVPAYDSAGRIHRGWVIHIQRLPVKKVLVTWSASGNVRGMDLYVPDEAVVEWADATEERARANLV